eukprot:4419235-Prymnesium_polylepis.3
MRRADHDVLRRAAEVVRDRSPQALCIVVGDQLSTESGTECTSQVAKKRKKTKSLGRAQPRGASHFDFRLPYRCATRAQPGAPRSPAHSTAYTPRPPSTPAGANLEYGASCA